MYFKDLIVISNILLAVSYFCSFKITMKNKKWLKKFFGKLKLNLNIGNIWLHALKTKSYQPLVRAQKTMRVPGYLIQIGGREEA